MGLYSKLNSECLFLASNFPQYFIYKYGFMTDAIDEYGGRGAPFYKFGVKSLDNEYAYVVGFHDGGLGEGVGFMDNFWTVVGEWFIKSTERAYTLSSLYGDGHAELLWLLSMQEVMRYRLDGFIPKTVVEVKALLDVNVDDTVKVYLLGSNLSSDTFKDVEGLALEYTVKYSNSIVSKEGLHKNWMHVLKADV